MSNVSLRVNSERSFKKLNKIVQKQVPFALKRTLDSLAYGAAKREMPEEANKTFDGGATPFTKRGFNYSKASKQKLMSSVYVNPNTHGYLLYQISGGVRTPNNQKILVPTENIKLNKFGNLTKGKRTSLFDNKKKYFTGIPKGKMGKDSLGIWERYGGKSNKKIRMVGKLADQATYNKKLPFKRTVKRYVTLHQAQVFEKLLVLALKSRK